MKVKRSKSLSPEPSSSNECKRPRIVDSAARDDDLLEPSLLNLSDDVLLNIMKYLHPQDLTALSLCCQRLEQVTRDRTLWSLVDFRSTPIFLEDLEKYIQFLRPLTTRLRMRGNLQSEKYRGLSQSFLTAIGEICHQLKELTMEEYAIDGNKIQITDFPKMVETLSLKGCQMCHLQSNKSYFFRMDLHMPNLTLNTEDAETFSNPEKLTASPTMVKLRTLNKTLIIYCKLKNRLSKRIYTCLILSKCDWFTPHSLMVISKMPKLKELRLDSCHRLGECVAYASLATRFGFKTLEVLDLRDTALGDSEICCFSSTKTLTHLYLECPPMLRTSLRSDSTQPQQQSIQQRVYEDQNILQILVEEGNFTPWNNFERCLISDRAVCSLGTFVCGRRILDNIQGMLFVQVDGPIVNNPNLKTLVVRYYPRVTNQSLVHLAENASSLEYLDVTGTAVTLEGVEMFRSQRPGVKILSSFDET